jgi:hypothetical protein
LPVVLTILGPAHKSDDSADKYENSNATNSTADHEIATSAGAVATTNVDRAKTVGVVGVGLVNPAFVQDVREVIPVVHIQGPKL